MSFETYTLVTKLSTSDMNKSIDFYERILNFRIDHRWTINSGGNFGTDSYVQMDYGMDETPLFTIGLYKDIDKPYSPPPQTGTVPSFIVPDIKYTLELFKEEKVHIDSFGGQEIIVNKSDLGYVDHFFFFRDPDNNSLVIRQNFGRQ